MNFSGLGTDSLKRKKVRRQWRVRVQGKGFGFRAEGLGSGARVLEFRASGLGFPAEFLPTSDVFSSCCGIHRVDGYRSVDLLTGE